MFTLDTHAKPSARVADGRLIISLPDAETPAVWMLDLAEAVTSVLRLENDRQGFYVIKKHGGKGAAETVAVYRDRARALRALEKTSSALERARSSMTYNGRPIVVRPVSKVVRFFNILLVFWFVLYLLGLDKYALTLLFMPFTADQPVAAAPAAPTAPESNNTAEPGSPPAGVPLSADDFLKSMNATGE